MKGNLYFYSETGTEGGFWCFEEKEKKGYEGLHILENGQHLRIMDKTLPSTNVWNGVVNLQHYPPFSKCVQGIWVHDIQRGVDPDTWMNWFLNEYPAELEID